MQAEGVLLGQLTPEDETPEDESVVEEGVTEISPPAPAAADRAARPPAPSRIIQPGTRIQPGDFGLDYEYNPGGYPMNNPYAHYMQYNHSSVPAIGGLPPMHAYQHQQPFRSPVAQLQQAAPITVTTTSKKPRGRPRKNSETTKKKAPAKTTGDTTTSSKNLQFSDKEKLMLSEIVLEILPLGPDKWEAVTQKFNGQVAEHRHRKVKNIRTKWNSMANSRMPTGNPHMPQWVLVVKRGKELMMREAQMVTEEDGADAVIDGDDDGSNTGVLVSGTPAPAPSSISTSTGTKTRKRTTSKKEEGDALLGYLKEQEKRQSKNQRKRDKKRAKRKKQEKEKDRQMMIDIVKTATVGIAAAFSCSGAEGGGSDGAAAAVAKAVNSVETGYGGGSGSSSDDSSQSSESTLSTIDSQDSPPMQRAKCKQAMRRARRLKLKKKTAETRNAIQSMQVTTNENEDQSSEEDDNPDYQEQLRRQEVLNAQALAEETSQPAQAI